MSGHGIDSPEDLGRMLSDIAKAVLERRGEAAATDTVRASAPKRAEDGETPREGQK